MFDDLTRSRRSHVLLALGAAFVARALYGWIDVPDYQGDSFHNWYLGLLTIHNHWIYADYKGREVVWLPFARYLGTLAMAASRRYDMLPGHVLNLILGTVTAGVTAALGAAVTGSRKWGLVAGLTVALSPWNVAYSWINMPEMTSGLLVALMVLAVLKGRGVWLLPLAFLGVLTRHNVTNLILILSLWLLWRRRWRDAGALLAGSAAGLFLWSAWTRHVTGDWLWWLHARSAGSQWEASFWVAKGLRPQAGLLTLPFTAVQIYAPFLVVAAALAVGLRSREWRRALTARDHGLFAYMVALHLLVIGVMQLRFFSYPDPRYLIDSVPAMAVLSVLCISSFADSARENRWLTAHGVVVMLSLVIQIPTFHYRFYSLKRDQMAGEALPGVAPEGGRIWVDAPVAIYFSGLDPFRFRSSDQLVGSAVPPSDTLPRVAERAILAQDVRMIYYDDVPFSRVARVWPRMAQGRAFTEGGLRFVPVFRYDPWRAPDPARPGLHGLLRQTIEGRYGPAMLWRVERVEEPPEA